jgi:hypothetical protein
MSYSSRIKRAQAVADIFEIVKDIVNDYFKVDQAGLLVGLSDLGAYGNGFIGAYYSPEANTIIINRRPLTKLMQARPDLYNFYLFHVMLHEYIHSLGSYDEEETRVLVEQVSRHYFGSDHPITQFATNIEQYIPDLNYATQGFEPPEDISIDFVLGIDRKNTNYIN